MDKKEIERYLQKLAEVYSQIKDAPPLKLGICGGAALSITGLIDRTTKDIDLLFPLHLPVAFFEAKKYVEDLLALKPTEKEIEAAARWCLTHDVSNGFK